MGELSDQVRRRLDAVFGDVLPSVTRDEQGVEATDEPGTAVDEELLANCPPHHDRD